MSQVEPAAAEIHTLHRNTCQPMPRLLGEISDLQHIGGTVIDPIHKLSNHGLVICLGAYGIIIER